MNWVTNTNFVSEQPKIELLNAKFRMEEEQNDKEFMQLNKFQDPTQNVERQACITLLTQFGNLLSTNSIHDMRDTVLTDDCEFFLFSSTGRTPVQYCLHPQDLHKLYEPMQIQNRRVREIYIDLEKGTAFQLCNFSILYQGEDSPMDEVVAEIFAIKNNKISKYRAFSGKMTTAHGDSDPFEITAKDRALALLKQINYALAGKPDFEKVADFLHENVKYKIWSWDSQKCFELEKHNFVESFQNMQENFVIKSIVPYSSHTRSQNIVGTYVYHLEGKTGSYANKKYIWPCTTQYTIDDDYKIIKVSQQGELHLEGQIEVPFILNSREKLLEKVQRIFNEGLNMDLFYSDVFQLNATCYTFQPDGDVNIGCCQGTTIVDKVAEWNNRNNIQKSAYKPILLETLVDCCDSGYDIIVLIYRLGKKLCSLEQSNNDIETDTIIVSRFKLEHGKVTNNCGFISHVPHTIPSPF